MQTERDRRIADSMARALLVAGVGLVVVALVALAVLTVYAVFQVIA